MLLLNFYIICLHTYYLFVFIFIDQMDLNMHVTYFHSSRGNGYVLILYYISRLIVALVGLEYLCIREGIFLIGYNAAR